MKKLLSALLTGAISVACLMGLSACGGESDSEPAQSEVKTTVTQEEWVNAFSFLMLEAGDEKNVVALADGRAETQKTNFSSAVDIDFTDFPIIHFCVDYQNQVWYWEGAESGDPNAYPNYIWTEDGKYYCAGEYQTSDIDGEYYFICNKEEIDEEEFQFYFEMCVSNAGGYYINKLELTDKYDNFTYSEENKEYSATIKYIEYYERYENGQISAYEVELTAYVVLKFEDGKLAEMVVGSYYVDDEGEEQPCTYDFAYTYGITLTVPEYYLNLELGETPKEYVG